MNKSKNIDRVDLAPSKKDLNNIKNISHLVYNIEKVRDFEVGIAHAVYRASHKINRDGCFVDEEFDKLNGLK